MKTIRLAVIAVLLCITATAFSEAFRKPSEVLWHLKNGFTNGNVASNYERASAAGSYSCDGDITICEIMDVPSSGNSNIPALSKGTPSSNLAAYDATQRP